MISRAHVQNAAANLGERRLSVYALRALRQTPRYGVMDKRTDKERTTRNEAVFASAAVLHGQLSEGSKGRNTVMEIASLYKRLILCSNGGA